MQDELTTGVRINHSKQSLPMLPLCSFHWKNNSFDIFYCVFFFFFKQKTAYEISECDWSSDVCSSDFFFFKQKTAYEISECDWSSDVCSSDRSEAHTSEPQYQSEVLYAAFCLGLEYRRD